MPTLPLAVDHFHLLRRLPARSGGSTAEIDETTVAYHSVNRWGGRADYPVELPAADGRVEAGPDPGGGELRGAQTGGTDAAKLTLLLELIGDLFRPGCLTWGRVSARGGRGAGHQQAYRQAGVYRLHAGRAAYSRLAAENIIPCTVELGGNRPTSTSPT